MLSENQKTPKWQAIAETIKTTNENKKDITLKNVYVLASAFEDRNSVIPVKLEVKEFSDDKNRLYLAVALSKIEKTGVKGDTALTKGERTRLLPVYGYSLPHFIKKINLIADLYIVLKKKPLLSLLILKALLLQGFFNKTF